MPTSKQTYYVVPSVRNCMTCKYFMRKPKGGARCGKFPINLSWLQSDTQFLCNAYRVPKEEAN